MTDLVLLHGATGSREEMAGLANLLAPEITCWWLDMIGHGGRPIPPSMDVPELAEDVIRQLDDAKLDRTFLLGYSFGGYLALYLACKYPERVIGCCTVGTKFRWDRTDIRQMLLTLARLQRTTEMVLPDPASRDPAYAQQEVFRALLQDARRRGSPLQEFHLRQMQTPLLALNGDADYAVTAEETESLLDLVPNVRVGIFAGSAHPMNNVPLQIVAELVHQFVSDVEVVAGNRFAAATRLAEAVA